MRPAMIATGLATGSSGKVRQIERGQNRDQRPNRPPRGAALVGNAAGQWPRASISPPLCADDDPTIIVETQRS
jgi:hypothetical protein